MSMLAGIVRGREIGKNRDGTSDVLLLQVEISDVDDIQTVELMTNAGDENSPVEGALVILIQIGSAWAVAVAVNDFIPPDIEVGERRIYSQDGGVRKATVYCRKNGDVELNGGDDYAVRFSALETAFNQLKAEFSAHSGHAASGSPPAPSTADISLAKVGNVRLPT